MKYFNNIHYKRPNYKNIKKKINILTTKLKETSDYQNYLKYLRKIINIQNELEEQYDYIDIRNMRNLLSPYYQKEISYWTKYKPKYDLLFIPFYHTLIKSPYKKELLSILTPNFFNTINYKLKISSKKITPLLKEEAILIKKYYQILNQKITYQDKQISRAEIYKYLDNSDRTIRKEAHNTLNNFYLTNQKKLEEVFLKLIEVRNAIALALNIPDYQTYSLYQLRRFELDYQDITKFRINIIKYIIPLCKKLEDIQLKNLNITNLEYYDTAFFNEMPNTLYKGNSLITKLEKTLNKIDKSLEVFYKEMLDLGYFDFEMRDNKVTFAITNYLTKTKIPVVTLTMKDIYTDIKTISHELGHAYQKFNSAKADKNHLISPLLKYPTFEIAEMFSYAMELIIMSNLEEIFNDNDYNKYCLLEIYNLISNLPYICAIDEFQEKIYKLNNPTGKHLQETWLELTEKYKLNTMNKGHENLEAGNYFYRQSHIFTNPFYYIDYALSYFGALSLWLDSLSTLDKFKKMSSVASYYPLKELTKKFDLPNPFEEESVKDIAKLLGDKIDFYISKILH